MVSGLQKLFWDEQVTVARLDPPLQTNAVVQELHLSPESVAEQTVGVCALTFTTVPIAVCWALDNVTQNRATRSNQVNFILKLE